MSPRCRRGRAWVFQWYLGLCGIEPLMPEGPKWHIRPRQIRRFKPCAGGRGSLPGRVCLSDVTVQVNQWRRNSGRGPQLFKRLIWSQHNGRAQYQANYLPEPRKPFKRDTVQLKEWVGFSVSKSLTLPSTPQWAGGDNSMIFPASPKKGISIILFRKTMTFIRYLRYQLLWAWK